jgi:outer membrane immunogenic protein
MVAGQVVAAKFDGSRLPVHPSHGPFSAALLAVLLAAPAVAADALVEAPAAAFNWSGFYAGVNAGYARGESTADYFALSPPGFTPMDPDGGLIGGYVGYNHQYTNNLVLGLDADLAYAHLDGTGPFVDGLFGPIPGETDSAQLEWSAAIRGRIGLAIGRVLPYFAGGVGSANPAFVGSWSDTYTGYTLGGGAELAVTDMVILRGEYRFTDFGGQSFANPVPETTHDVDLSTNEVRFGVAVKF